MNKLDLIILNSNGRFIGVDFVKKDGTLRHIVGRLGVKKHLKGGVSTLNPTDFITIYDVQNEGYRAINRNTIKAVYFEGVKFDVV